MSSAGARDVSVPQSFGREGAPSLNCKNRALILAAARERCLKSLAAPRSDLPPWAPTSWGRIARREARYAPNNVLLLIVAFEVEQKNCSKREPRAVRGDFLVVDAVQPNRSPRDQFPANRGKEQGNFQFSTTVSKMTLGFARHFMMLRANSLRIGAGKLIHENRE